MISAVKGQSISKCLFCIFNSHKKQTRKFDFTTMVPRVELFSFNFWENWRHQNDFSKLTDLYCTTWLWTSLEVFPYTWEQTEHCSHFHSFLDDILGKLLMASLLSWSLKWHLMLISIFVQQRERFFYLVSGNLLVSMRK